MARSRRLTRAFLSLLQQMMSGVVGSSARAREGKISSRSVSFGPMQENTEADERTLTQRTMHILCDRDVSTWRGG